MKKLSLLEYITGALFLIGIGVIVYSLLVLNKNEEPGESPLSAECSQTQKVKVSDNYIRDFYKKGEEVIIHLGGANCGALKHGEVILFQISTQLDPVFRIVRGLPGDRFEVFLNEEQGRWNLKINGDLVTFLDKPFGWGHTKAAPPLKKHETLHDGIVPKGKFIMLSQIPPGTKDSGTFGLVDMTHVTGRIQ